MFYREFGLNGATSDRIWPARFEVAPETALFSKRLPTPDKGTTCATDSGLSFGTVAGRSRERLPEVMGSRGPLPGKPIHPLPDQDDKDHGTSTSKSASREVEDSRHSRTEARTQRPKMCLSLLMQRHRTSRTPGESNKDGGGRRRPYEGSRGYLLARRSAAVGRRRTDRQTAVYLKSSVAYTLTNNVLERATL